MARSTVAIRPALPERLRRPRLVVRWAVLLAMALVLAQSLGLLHRLAHGADLPQGAGGHAAPAEAATHVPGVRAQHVHAQDEDRHDEHDGHAHGLAGLFSGHVEGADCRLYDTLLQQQVLPPALVALPPVKVAPMRLDFRTAGFPARRVAWREARGPPAFS